MNVFLGTCDYKCLYYIWKDLAFLYVALLRQFNGIVESEGAGR